MSVLAFNLPLVPDQASEQAGQVDAIFFALTALSALLVIALFGAIAYCLIRYRAKSTADRTLSKRGQYVIEATWTVVPMGLFIGLFIWGAVVYVQARNPPKDALTIYVVGLQWYWDIRHEDGPHEVGELHVPVNQAVRLLMTSNDVIHDFYVPAFRTKMDVLPGKYTVEWFKPTKTGRYDAFCNQYCGTKHAQMTASVVVMKPEDYQVWLANTGASAATVAEAGEKVFRAKSCSGCHGEHSQVAAPDLHNLFGHPVPLANGKFVTADDQYLRDSILNPGHQVVAGFRPIMPSYQGQINESDLMALLAYLKSLSPPASLHP